MTGHAGGRPQSADVDTAAGTGAGPELSMQVDRHGTAVTVSLRGRLDELAAVEALLTALLAHRGSVVCDLRGLDYVSPRAVGMLIELQCTRPPTPPALALCVIPGPVSQALAAHDLQRYLPLFPDVGHAHHDLLHAHRRASLALTTDPAAAGRSRAFAAGVCAQWSLHEVIDDVVLVVSELVTNAVVHARTKAELLLACGGGMLSVAVADHASTLPKAGSGDPLAPGGRGLQLVTGLAETVGSYRTAGGSKVVWCALRLPEAA
jgi:anti-sigma regulatory factor (Ser/Thr protein kinase)/anti-anti-sigma regulatory factor